MSRFVAVLMGSDSDLQVMQEALNVLEAFQIPHEVRILSAHRTPDATATSSLRRIPAAAVCSSPARGWLLTLPVRWRRIRCGR